MRLFDIGFLPVRVWDILDILIVGYLIYQLFKLLRGSLAYNIFIGVISIFVVSLLVRFLEMELLSMILGQLFSVGVIMLLIVFQPEVRRFLLILGNNTLRQRSNIFSRLLDNNLGKDSGSDFQIERQSIRKALLRMGRNKTGALMVFSDNFNLSLFEDSGVRLDAKITQPLIESIFSKDSPLHDGAMIINNNLIHSASCVLPVSNNSALPEKLGLRHRSALGITEQSSVAVFIVSEETGAISFAHQGKFKYKINEEELNQLLDEHF